MGLVHVARHLTLTETAANTFKALKKDLNLPVGAKAAVIEDIIMEVDTPSIVASTLCQVYGAVAIGNQEATMSSCTISQAGTILKEVKTIVSDATPLPVIYDSVDPLDREGPFPLVKDPDGAWYVTLGVQGVANAGVKGVHARLDMTVEV
jgi:hypothetical protein